MASKLALRQYVSLPSHPAGDFDHGDVHLQSGRVFIANTAAGTVEVVDGEHMRHLATIPGCPEASGVLCAQQERLIFAAARGAGKLLVIDSTTNTVLRTVAVGPRPNDLAWDQQRHHLLVADVQENQAYLVDPRAGEVITKVELPGRPGWAVYHQAADRFLVNIREPACVAVLSGSTEAILKKYDLTSDLALVLLGKIVNGADTDNTLWNQPEGPGLEAIAEGFRHLGYKDDHEQNAAEWIVYDALYAYCQEMMRQGKPNGDFVS